VTSNYQSPGPFTSLVEESAGLDPEYGRASPRRELGPEREGKTEVINQILKEVDQDTYRHVEDSNYGEAHMVAKRKDSELTTREQDLLSLRIKAQKNLAASKDMLQTVSEQASEETF
jgi:hypothetical protein